jgi:hypothetical protein
MTLPARNRPPPPFPGSPEAIKADEERVRIINEAQAKEAKGTKISIPKASLAVPSSTSLVVPFEGKLKPFPELPPSTRLEKIPEAVKDYSSGDIALPTATGNKPATHVAHQWGDDPTKKNSQPDWLNDNGGQTRTCRVCGVTCRKDLIRVDRKGMSFHYVDAFGVAMTSMIELDCPTFLGDVPGAVGEAKQRIRGLDSHVETIDARLDRLEQHNAYLQTQLEAKIQLDVTSFVSWLAQMAAMSAQAALPTTSVAVGSLPLEIPSPIADLIRGIGTQVPVKVPVTVDAVFEDDAEEAIKKEGNQ